MQKSLESPRLFPWYVHVFGGWSIGALFPWYLTSRQFYLREQKKTACLLMGGTISLFLILSFLASTAQYSWDNVLFCFLTINLVLSISAWLVQRKFFGSAAKRYYLHEWKNWIAPILIAVVFGVGYTVTLSLFPLIGDRVEMYQSQDLLAKKVLLWDFFHRIPYSLIFSIPVGIWWAGERERFSASNILSYFFGLIIFSAILYAMAGLFYFLLCQGQSDTNQTSWTILSNDMTGLKKILHFFEEKDFSTYLMIPLLLGTVTKISDFGKRSLTIFPLLTLSFLLLSGLSPKFWQFYQNQIFYDMSSEDIQQRENAHDRAIVLLKRFPQHDGWPAIASTVARYYSQQKDYSTAKELYRHISERTQDAPRWHKQAALAAASLNSPTFGLEDSQFSLTIPPLRYESYMTNNWMTLIRTLRFHESSEMSETDTLIQLKDISDKDEKIELSPMPTLAELDDNATNLGYSVLLLPSNLATLKQLIQAGYPVIQPVKQTFHLLSGFDENRAVITGSSYENILDFLKKTDKEGVADNTLFAEESIPSESNQKTRIDILAYTEIPFSFWQTPRQKDSAEYVAVVFPPQDLEDIVSVLGEKETTLLQQSKAYLAALIGLNSIKCGDTIGAVNWAKRSNTMLDEPFSLHVAHLATLLWQSRHSLIANKLDLEKQLPELASVETFLTEKTTQSFLAVAGQQFRHDLENNLLNWTIRQQYTDFLDRSDPLERQHLITLAETNVLHDPDSRVSWLFLTGLYEWEKDREKMIYGYSGALAADMWDNEIALKLAYLHIQQGHYEKAQEIINRVQPKSIRYQPDYYYCLASLAQWQNDFNKAGKYYEKAIKMRRYDRNYHLDYAKMLEKTGQHQKKIERLKSWVSRLDGTISVNLNR